MFAGPNGSGKSTLKAYLPTDLLGSYLNPDEIEQSVRDRGFLDVAQHGVVANGPEVLQFFRDSALLAEAGLTAARRTLELKTDLIPAWFRRAVLDQTAIRA
jgi:ABC-type molybdenum transport system ATPase subunit/photorepair protein PhrA